ncbi:hypothetical protein [Deinococcus arenicola]|uniref:Uncharacterized protein n=1 Tax=Deinococcus arenicola TaxID=2994950 RepID=A0ABU4DQN1_9DEIO|nr:hypothetical protein [Deinococcus sp. ZS9-10]MDV6374747.1 hypothetical protein [Deinococcus sp. ZS9-10]
MGALLSGQAGPPPWLLPVVQDNSLYAVMIAVIAVYWALRVAREARLGYLPRVAWWALPGLALLLLTPVLDVPALLGIGAAFLLLAEFWPDAYRRSPSRPLSAWPLVSVLTGAALTWSVIQAGQPEPVAVVAALGALLAGVVGLLGVVFYPKTGATAGGVAVRPSLNFQTRWHRALTPEWPDLSVTLSEQGAHLKNISKRPVRLAGWSPAGINAWYHVRDPDGRVMAELRAGQEALLPLGERDSGVRVWYGPDKAQDAYLFRADWTPTARADQRVLN